MFETIFYILLVAVAGYFLWTKVIRPRVKTPTPTVTPTPTQTPGDAYPRYRDTDTNIQ